MDSFTGRIAFITGGARGIGLGIARACARAGAKLALVDIDEGALAQARAELSPLTKTETYVLDVRDREAYARVADQVESDLGVVSLLVNNAGVFDNVSPATMDYALWDWVMDINVNGVYNGIQTFVPRMISNGGDHHIVNTASVAGLAMFDAGFLYHASKYAIVGLTESLHAKLAQHGIGVSLLCPGPVATDLVNNTQRLRPEHAPAHSERMAGALERFQADLTNHGTSIDTVGNMVLDAIREGRLYIHTDDSAAPAIIARTEALLAALPSALRIVPESDWLWH
ncbi:SDR family NAD(P)-dependent oxidoreductase [Kutzneria viridogrisea]|uniref:NAD(P)-dependent dehydrogenase (Short-subunit alcohol dehydrogenase family) n=1 Tax=Kutzneria viridogrisea TaxID=47990 RepID=A0ABR6B9B3_9PSEU|nr:NAD(P)-dependent dehydrogenase (short-subunit alcohol dehydrogenase family) [Kutzneria viridogrisea]